MYKVYISGPYRASTEARVAANIQAAREEALIWWELGAAVFCPHMNSAWMGGATEDERFLQADLEFLYYCDALIALPLAIQSEGSRRELEAARKWGLQIYNRLPFLNDLHTALWSTPATDESPILYLGMENMRKICREARVNPAQEEDGTAASLCPDETRKTIAPPSPTETSST